MGTDVYAYECMCSTSFRWARAGKIHRAIASSYNHVPAGVKFSPPTWTWAQRLQMTRSEVDSRPWLSAKRRAQGLPLSWHGHRFQEKNVVGFDFKQLVSLCQTNGHKIPKSCDSKMLLAPPHRGMAPIVCQIHSWFIMVKVAPNCLYLSFQVTSLPLPKHPVWLWCRQKPRFATGNRLLTVNPSSFQSLHPLTLLGWHHLTLDRSPHVHPSGIARDHEKTTHQDILLQVAFKRRSQDPRLLFGDKLLLISLRPPRACEIHPQMLLYLYIHSTHRLMSTEVPTFAPMVTCRSWVSSFRAVRLLVLNRAKCATTIGKTRAKRHPSMQSRPRR